MDENLRAVLTAGSKWARPSWYTNDSPVFSGVVGQTIRLTIQAREGKNFLITGGSVLRTFNPENAGGIATTYLVTAPLRWGTQTVNKQYTLNPMAPVSNGAGLNTGYTWPDYIWLKPLEMFYADIQVDGTQSQQYTLTTTGIEFLS